jgi:hypothetical protein
MAMNTEAKIENESAAAEQGASSYYYYYYYYYSVAPVKKIELEILAFSCWSYATFTHKSRDFV